MFLGSARVYDAISVDIWKYYDITHADHVHLNPLSGARLEEVIDLLDLKAGAQVLDVGCGRAELLIRLAERYGAKGVGIDRSPYTIKRARDEVQRRSAEGQVVLFHQDGGDYFAPPASFDVTMCLGATFAFQGYRGTLRALARMVRPDGLVLIGEPYWIRDPAPEYLAALELPRDVFGTHAQNVRAGEQEGLTPVYAVGSTPQDFDRYEALQWRAAQRWARSNPDDPDVVELLSRVARNRDAYLTWGRDTLGWALYLFAR